MKINFKANLVSRTSRYYSSRRQVKSEVIEIFKLDKSDVPFAEKCVNILAHYHKRELPGLQKRIKVFFENFVNEKDFASKDYYLAVKNSNSISGGVISLPIADKVFVLDSFSSYPKSYNMDILTYGFFTGIKEEYPVHTVATNGYFDRFKNKKTEFRTSRIPEIKRDIKSFYTGSIFEKVKPEKIDLDELFGTDSFELKVNPYLF